MGSNKKKKGSFLSGIVYLSLIYFLGFYTSSIIIKNDSDTFKYSTVTTEDKAVDDIISKLENALNVKAPDDKKDELLILNAIYENNNLTDEEKNLFYGFYSVVDDIESLDRKRAYDALSKVNITYKERGKEIPKTTLGDYNYRNGNINIYKTNDSDNNVLYHEGIHCLFNNELTDHLPRAFCEGMTELLTNEFFSKDPFYENKNYPYEVCYVKMLCELVGKDLVLDAFTSGDMYLIYDEMDKYNESNYPAIKILDIYEDAFNESKTYSTTEKWAAFDYLENIYKKSHPNLENYQDFNYFYELSASAFEESPSEFFNQYIYYYGVLEKVYFNSELKEQFPTSNLVNLNSHHNNVEKSKKLVNLTR